MVSEAIAFALSFGSACEEQNEYSHFRFSEMAGLCLRGHQTRRATSQREYPRGAIDFESSRSITNFNHLYLILSVAYYPS